MQSYFFLNSIRYKNAYLKGNSLWFLWDNRVYQTLSVLTWYSRKKKNGWKNCLSHQFWEAKSDCIGCEICALHLPYVVYSIQKQGPFKENIWDCEITLRAYVFRLGFICQSLQLQHCKNQVIYSMQRDRDVSKLGVFLT